MAYLIQCHVVDKDSEIRVSVNFYGDTETEADEAYEENFSRIPLLVEADEVGNLMEEEGEIEDDERPQLEEVAEVDEAD